MNKKQIIVMSAPSCSGKNSIYEVIHAIYPHITQTVSDTTRKIRPGETAGVDYNYITENEFLDNIKNGAYAEYNLYDNNYYGTPVSQVEKLVESGKPFVLIIDVNGALKIKKLYAEKVLMIFIMPPSMEELKNRIIARGTNTPEEIERRINTAQTEIEQSESYDFCIINDDLSKASEQVIKIIENEIL